MYSVPTPLYDIHPKDFSHPSYVDQFNGHLNTGSGEPLYPPSRLPFNGMLASTFQSPHAAFYHQSPDGGLVSAFQPNGFTFDGRLAPAFQYNEMPPLSRNAPSPSSLSSPFEATLTPPGPSLGSILQLYPELEDNLPPLPAAPRARRRRTRGPNKRPPGTGFSYLLEKLPMEVRAALEEYYPDCPGCGEKPPPEGGKDSSSRQKHIFSNNHCARLSKEIQEQLPNFVCPAFIAFHGQCSRARPGRYDSAERHCKKCPGFQEIKSNIKSKRTRRDVFPVEITKGQHKAIKNYRANNNPSAETARQVLIPLNRLLVMMIEAGMPLATARTK